jgi:hypothetical protein
MLGFCAAWLGRIRLRDPPPNGFIPPDDRETAPKRAEGQVVSNCTRNAAGLGFLLAFSSLFDVFGFFRTTPALLPYNRKIPVTSAH